MKDSIYKFINEYISYREVAKEYKLSVEKITEFPKDSKLKKMIDVLRVSDSESYNNILGLDEDEVLYEYLKFVHKYYDSKKMLRISTQKIAELVNVSDRTIKRFENLQTVANFKMICTMAKTVNLTLTWN